MLMFDGIPDPQPTLDRGPALKLVAIVVSLVVLIVVTLYFVMPKSVQWSIASGKLQIDAGVWIEEFPLGEFEKDHARILDLDREPEWKPGFKLFGYDGFGVWAGRFQLRNGNRVELYLGNETQAVLIPRRDKVPVLIGVKDPAIFLRQLQVASN